MGLGYVVLQHSTVRTNLSWRILSDAAHPNHKDLTKYISTVSACFECWHLFTSTETYKLSVFPYLNRFFSVLIACVLFTSI